jgi:hypothetical protein
MRSALINIAGGGKGVKAGAATGVPAAKAARRARRAQKKMAAAAKDEI